MYRKSDEASEQNVRKGYGTRHHSAETKLEKVKPMQPATEFLFINLGVPELSIIVLLVLILFGPGKLPGVMKALGDGVRQFKSAASTDAPKMTGGSDKTE
jgi:sec-independent protein translocase protein TatA